MQYDYSGDKYIQDSQEFINFLNYLNDSKDSSSGSSNNNLNQLRHLLENTANGGDKNINQKQTKRSNLNQHDKNKNQNLEEIFKCFICFSRVRQPQMCPHCSKLCCSACIKKWLIEQKSQCPHCRGPLKVSQLVNCRFVSEITTVLDNMHIRENEEELCKNHRTVMQYFCKTCSIPICSDCAMLGTTHKLHEFEHINKIYEQHVEVVKAESQAIKKRLKDLTKEFSYLEVLIDKATKTKEDKAQEITHVVEQMNERLDNQLKSKLINLIAQKSSISDEIEFLEGMSVEINRQINESPKNVLIFKSDELVKMLREINNKPVKTLNRNDLDMQFTSELIPSYESNVFELKPFSVLNKNTEVIYSDVFFANCVSWRLKVYPNGNGEAKGIYLSVFLEMINGLNEDFRYEYRIEMVNQKNPSMSVVREYSSEFESGESWGYIRFFKLENLEKDGFLNVDNDSIILKYHVRPPSYFYLCQDQKKYIKKAESEKKKRLQEITELRHKLALEQERNSKLIEMMQNSGTVIDSARKLAITSSSVLEREPSTSQKQNKDQSIKEDQERKKTSRETLNAVIKKPQDLTAPNVSDKKPGFIEERPSFVAEGTSQKLIKDSLLRSEENLLIQVNESAVFLPNKQQKSSPSNNNQNTSFPKPKITIEDSINSSDVSTKYALDSCSKRLQENFGSMAEKKEKVTEVGSMFTNIQSQNAKREKEILETLEMITQLERDNDFLEKDSSASEYDENSFQSKKTEEVDEEECDDDEEEENDEENEHELDDEEENEDHESVEELSYDNRFIFQKQSDNNKNPGSNHQNEKKKERVLYQEGDTDEEEEEEKEITEKYLRALNQREGDSNIFKEGWLFPNEEYGQDQQMGERTLNVEPIELNRLFQKSSHNEEEMDMDYASNGHVRNLLPNFEMEASNHEKLKQKVKVIRPDDKSKKKQIPGFLALSDNLIKKLENMKLVPKSGKLKSSNETSSRIYNKTEEEQQMISDQVPFEKENKKPAKRKFWEKVLINPNNVDSSQETDKRKEVKIIEAKGSSLELYSERSLGK